MVFMKTGRLDIPRCLIIAVVALLLLSSNISARPEGGFVGPTSSYADWLQMGKELNVTFLDVGQGDSILIQYNGKNILIDGGSADMGPRVVSYLKSHDASNLKMVIATLPYDDHIGGLIDVIQSIRVAQFIDSGQVHTSQTYENLLNLIDKKNIPYKVAEVGQVFTIEPTDPNLTLQIISPSKQFEDINDNSIVLKLTYNKVTFLLMADAGIEAENRLLTSGYNLNADILKVGHNGNRSAFNFPFLQAVSPRISIISVGSDNTYGPPDEVIISTLNSLNSIIYRTDLNGNIAIACNGVTYSVTPQKETSTAPKIEEEHKTWFDPTTLSSTNTKTISKTSGQTETSNTQSVYQGPFVGSSKSDKYHYPSCSAAKRIKPENLITFSSSEEARRMGYTPCSKCNPP